MRVDLYTSSTYTIVNKVCPCHASSGMQIIAGSRENYPTVDAIFPAVKHYFFIQNVFKCCQKVVIYLFRLFTPSLLSYLN